MMVVKVVIFVIVRIVVIISAHFMINVIKLVLKYFDHCVFPHVYIAPFSIQYL